MHHNPINWFTSILDFNDDDSPVSVRKIYLSREPINDSLHSAAMSREYINIPEKEGVLVSCIYDAPEDATYVGEITEVVSPEHIDTGEAFEVEIKVSNAGTAAWFSNGLGCDNQVEINMATANGHARASIFGESSNSVYGWINESRIGMVEDIVHPGEEATFRFVSAAPDYDNWYKEFFVPVAEGISFMEDSIVEIDLIVGDIENIDTSILNVVEFSSNGLDFEGEKSFKADLSDQLITLYVGEDAVRTFPMSSGAYNTPTPIGTYTITEMQELRIGGTWPHYRMPNWMRFTGWGHGIHALPYLETDGGSFWYEALSNIGTPVSHGCIRTLPDDSDLIYDFGEMGMDITIER